MSARHRLEHAATRSRSLDERATAARRELWDAMAEARADGMTLREIADICMLSRQRVMEILRGLDSTRPEMGQNSEMEF